MEYENLYQKAIKKWGSTAQVFMLLEEMAELQKEISKSFRGRDNKKEVCEEIADVEIMLEQMKVLFECGTEVRHQKELKLLRLESLLKEENN